VFTSDIKKNWSIVNFRQLVDKLYQIDSSLKIQILSSKTEKEVLIKYFEEEEICTWNLQEIASEFCSNDMVISGDTAVMHIAAQKEAQVVELALGSSDPWRTGPYGEGHIVLQSTVGCYPCPHSRPCRQISHFCGESLSVNLVSSVVEALLAGTEISTSNKSVQIYKTHLDPEIGWWLEQHGEGKGGYRLMNKILWQFLDRRDFTFGSSIISYFLKKSLPILEKTQGELRGKMFDLQSKFETLIQKLGNGEITGADIQAVRRDMAAIQSSEEIAEWLWSFRDLSQLPFATPLHFLSAFQDRLEQLKAVVYHREKLIMDLKSGGIDESRSRKISQDGFAET
jgi:hypothetical protein